MMLAKLILTFSAFSFPGFAMIQDGDVEPPPLRYDQSLDTALAEAKAKNTFVLVALPEDWPGEGHGSLGGAFWYHKSLRKSAAKGRAVIGSPCKHSENESGSDRNGKAMERVCSRFGQMLCEQHREIEKQTIARFFDGLEPAARPAFLVIRASDGVVVARRLGDPAANELAETISAASSAIESGENPSVPAELLGKATDEDANVRNRSLRVLASLEFPSADAARKKLLEEAKDDARRAELLLAIAECGSKCEPSVIAPFTDSKNATVRAAAMRAFGGSGHVSGVEPLLKSWPKAREDEEKKAIVRALGRCGRQSEPARELLKKAASDTKTYVRANAMIAIGEALYADASAVKLLKSRAETDGDSKVRGAAVFALVNLRNAEPKDTIAFLRARKAKEKDAKVIEVMNSGVAFLDGSLNDELHWPLEIFCGDPKQ
ncbi:MAG: HEAT repeat domain-containing protein [Planctomycetota bacterium]